MVEFISEHSFLVGWILTLALAIINTTIVIVGTLVIRARQDRDVRIVADDILLLTKDIHGKVLTEKSTTTEEK